MDPLAQPENRELLDQFRSFCRTTGAGEMRQQLESHSATCAHGARMFAERPTLGGQMRAYDLVGCGAAALGELARAFASIPYENLTKIVKDAECGAPGTAFRAPQEVLADHQRWGTGGTCFSLTATLLHLVRCLGIRAEPILADRRYGADTHCALILWLDDQPHLLDPGYLIVDPVPLAAGSNELVVPTQFNEIQLLSTGRDRLQLYTIQQGDRRHRLTFKTDPVDDAQFRRAWEASFDWDMMHYPLLTKVMGNQQVYMRGGHLQRRSPTQVLREEIPDQLLAERMADEFGIHPQMIQRALQVLRRKRHGR